MAVLKNAKHELFAQALAAGKTQIEAHEDAGYKPHRGNASLLAQDKSIVARVSEILERRQHIEAKATEKAIEALAVTKEAVLGELAKIGFANMLDFIRIGEEGLPYTDFTALTREQAAAIGELVVETIPARFRDGEEIEPEVKKVRFKLSDKRSALVDLGKHLGLFIDRHEHSGPDGGPIETKDVTELEAARRVAFLLTSAASKA